MSVGVTIVAMLAIVAEIAESIVAGLSRRKKEYDSEKV